MDSLHFLQKEPSFLQNENLRNHACATFADHRGKQIAGFSTAITYLGVQRNLQQRLTRKRRICEVTNSIVGKLLKRENKNRFENFMVPADTIEDGVGWLWLLL